MYIDNENFDKWMERLSKKLGEIGQNLQSLINTDKVLDENDRLLDNQDLAFLLKVSFRTLQRYRASGKLPFFMISHIFPLALRGKAFGFSVLQEHAVMTPVISIFFVMLIIRYLSIHISIKK